MRKIKLFLKILPIVGDFIQDILNKDVEKTPEWWIASVLDLLRTIATAIGAGYLITNLDSVEFNF
jgi:hypothetical protein